MTTSATIETRLAELEARADIRRLMAEYSYGCDQHDADRFARAFSKDAFYDVGEPFGSATGHDGIRVMLDKIAEASPETHHWITDVTVDFPAADHATGEAHTIVHMRNADGEYLVSANYENEYRVEDGRWVMSICRVIVHWWKKIEVETV